MTPQKRVRKFGKSCVSTNTNANNMCFHQFSHSNHTVSIVLHYNKIIDGVHVVAYYSRIFIIHQKVNFNSNNAKVCKTNLFNGVQWFFLVFARKRCGSTPRLVNAQSFFSKILHNKIRAYYMDFSWWCAWCVHSIS